MTDFVYVIRYYKISKNDEKGEIIEKRRNRQD